MLQNFLVSLFIKRKTGLKNFELRNFSIKFVELTKLHFRFHAIEGRLNDSKTFTQFVFFFLLQRFSNRKYSLLLSTPYFIFPLLSINIRLYFLKLMWEKSFWKCFHKFFPICRDFSVVIPSWISSFPQLEFVFLIMK